MSDYLFLILLVAGALWTIGRTIREAAWTVTPEAAEERKQAAEHARFVDGLKQGS
jgi:Na+-transporting methylmalonyl-CoA/oxaloacetate decarboxylase gamma subunit